ncbi:MFS transporter (plasmid) [Sphingobium sp. SCG-1]|nr:MFS transporter [Sphingobium sp. SCG-1]
MNSKPQGLLATHAASMDDICVGPDRSTMEPLVGLSLAMLLPSLATSIANAALPVLAQSFTASFQAAQWILLAYLLAITAMIVVAGTVGDRLGRRRLLLAGVGLFSGASLLCGAAPTLGWLIAARVGQGLGAAIMMALATAFVADVVPKGRLGRAMGLMGTMSAIGTTLGPSLGGMLTTMAGWPAIFLVNGPLGVVTFLILWRTLPSDRVAPARDRAAIDILGIVLLILTLGAYTLAMTIGRGRFGLANVALLLLALLAAGVFVLAQMRVRSPLIRLAMFRNAALRTGLAASVLVSAIMMATLVVGPFYLSRALLLNGTMLGIVLSAGPFVAALSGMPAGRLVDRHGIVPMIIGGLAAMLVGTLALAVLPQGGLASYVLPIVIITAGYALFQAANNSMIMAQASPDQRGVNSGLLNLARNLGLITGTSVMGAVFAYGVAGDVVTASPVAIGVGLRMTFAMASLLVVLAMAMMRGLGRVRTLGRTG